MLKTIGEPFAILGFHITFHPPSGPVFTIMASPSVDANHEETRPWSLTSTPLTFDSGEFEGPRLRQHETLPL
jgi:hypothetical protein